MDETFEQLQRERDFYLRLLDLGGTGDLEHFLRDALAAAVDLTGARQGYLELRESDSEEAVWSLAQACSGSDLERIRTRISRGIIAEALATGETVSTHSALLDRRFRERESVQREKIQAVLCAPLVAPNARGVVYLQGRDRVGPFEAADVAAAERFAAHLAVLAGGLVARQRVAREADAMAALRARHRLDGIFGSSVVLAAAVDQAMLAAPLGVSVLLTGESGTGKSQLARAIHDNSPRAAAPFVEINCAAIPETLVESELFGARAGSHAEARRDRPGKVAAAEGGTLFLDEITELPVDSQAKLLQLLQSKSYYALGAEKPSRADVRVIAATNTDLETAMQEKRLRPDLYYRLQVLPIRMPPLRERRSDVPAMARALCQRVCERHDLPSLELSPQAEAAIASAEWRGNVRELENALEAAAIRAAGQCVASIEVAHVFPSSASVGAESDPSFQEATRRFQRDLLERTLRSTDWNVSEAARRLDLARSHVYNLVKAFGLTRDGSEREPGGAKDD